MAKLAKINAYHVSLFGYFLDKLKSTPDGDGSLLDHSMYLLGSGLGNPDVHDHTKLPILVAGGASGQLKGGCHLVLALETPMMNQQPPQRATAAVRWNKKNKQGWTPLRIAAGVHRGMHFRGSPPTAAALRKVMSAAGVSTEVEPEAVISGATK